MFNNHSNGISLRNVESFSNAMAERLNGKIQEIKTVARGYRIFKNFRSAILFFKINYLELKPLNLRCLKIVHDSAYSLQHHKKWANKLKWKLRYQITKKALLKRLQTMVL